MTVSRVLPFDFIFPSNDESTRKETRRNKISNMIYDAPLANTLLIVSFDNDVTEQNYNTERIEARKRKCSKKNFVHAPYVELFRDKRNEPTKQRSADISN